eukprot:5013546-Pleurochrysis_carterae.AAC.1
MRASSAEQALVVDARERANGGEVSGVGAGVECAVVVGVVIAQQHLDRVVRGRSAHAQHASHTAAAAAAGKEQRRCSCRAEYSLLRI